MKVPSTGMMLAAGLGTRMRPITDHTPKPLVKVAGKCLIDWGLDQMGAAGVERVVVNVHHLAPQLIDHLRSRHRPTIEVSNETVRLLDTGGGVIKALPLLGNEPFVVFNCDAIVQDGPAPMLRRLSAAWTDSLDVLMLVHPRATAHGFDGAGDFFMADDGTPIRRGAQTYAPFVYAGVYIIHPRALSGEKPEPFSMNKIWDRAIASSRMRLVAHDGAWFHVGTPDAVGATEVLLGARPHLMVSP